MCHIIMGVACGGHGVGKARAPSPGVGTGGTEGGHWGHHHQGTANALTFNFILLIGIRLKAYFS